MEILTSNRRPLKFDNKCFVDKFSELIAISDYIQIASGYISAASLTEIRDIIESNNGPHLNLLIGMHYFDGIMRSQYDAALYLNDFLVKNNLGSVSIAKTFRFHGKLYSFSKENKIIAGIIGSSNLDSMLKSHITYETDLFVTEAKISQEINTVIENAINNISVPITDWQPASYEENNKILEGTEGVEKINSTTVTTILKKLNEKVSFEIPLKTTPKSNLNCHFGKGRENKLTKRIIRRPWYEVELIVPKKITISPYYPKAGDGNVTVYTDDGWKFDCLISGTNSKNFRASGDLQILGKWIKGRLENYGALKVGESVTEGILRKYGRNSFKLIATDDPKIWWLDFGVNKIV